MGLRAIIATGAFAAVAGMAQAAPGTLLAETATAKKTCAGDMPFRAAVYIVSPDEKRPGLVAFSIGNTTCLADPAPQLAYASHLAYLTAQLAPVYVLDRVQREGRPSERFAFAYKDNRFEMQLRATRVDSEMMTNHTLVCYDYDFVHRDSANRYLASGDMQVCLPEHRLRAGNLPAMPVAEASKGPPEEKQRHRNMTEPRDKQYYGS